MAEKINQGNRAAYEGVFEPDKIYFLKSSSGDFSDEIRVLDLSTGTAITTFDRKVTDGFCKEVVREYEAKKHDAAISAFELTRKTFSSKMQFHDVRAAGNLVSELDMPLIKHYGKWTISFPEQSPHSSHIIETQPVAIWKGEETFVKDSIPYVWESGGDKRGFLSKVVDGQKLLIAEFSAKKWFQNNCVVALDSTMLDSLVVLASCVAVLNR